MLFIWNYYYIIINHTPYYESERCVPWAYPALCAMFTGIGFRPPMTLYKMNTLKFIHEAAQIITLPPRGLYSAMMRASLYVLIF